MNYDIVDINKKLIGDISPQKNMSSPEDLIKRLHEYNYIITALFEELIDVVEYKDNEDISIQKVALEASNITQELQSYINDMMVSKRQNENTEPHKNTLEIQANLPFNIGDTIADKLDFKYRVCNIEVRYDIGAHQFKYILDLTRLDVYALFSTDDISNYHLVDASIVY